MTASFPHNRTGVVLLALMAFLLSATFPHMAEAGLKKRISNEKPQHTLIIRDAFVRIPTANTNSAVVYMNIVNNSDKTEHLTEASSPAAEHVELHKIMKSHGMRRMHEVEEIVLPPHTTVQLKLGTYHLMLVGLTHSLEIGAKVPIELTFSLAGKVNLSVPVADITTGKQATFR